MSLTVFVRVAGMNDEIEGTTIMESNGGEVANVACRQSPHAQRLGECHHGCIDEAQIEVGKAPVSFIRLRLASPSG